MPDPERDSLDGMHGIAGHSIEDLSRKSPGSSPDDRLAFPHGLRNGQTESLLNRFLKDNRGGSLKGIDFTVRFGRQLQHMDVGIAGTRFPDIGQHRFAFRIMHDPRPARMRRQS